MNALYLQTKHSATITPTQHNAGAKKVSVIIRATELLVPFDYKAELLLLNLIKVSNSNHVMAKNYKREWFRY